MTDWNTWAERELAGLRAIDRYREPIPFDGDGPTGRLRDRVLVSFASNDYLGLASHPQVKLAAIVKAYERYDKQELARDRQIPYHPGAIKFYREKGIWKG